MLTVDSFTFNPFSENTYLVYNQDKECIIIDPGCYSLEEKKTLINHIEKNNLRPMYIFLTHSHIDHIFGLAAIKLIYNVPILGHPKADMGLKSTHLVAKLYGLSIDDPPPIDQFMNNGDIVQLGKDHFQILFCPGHAPDHLVLYADHGLGQEEGFAIVGDVIFKESIGRYDLPGGDFNVLMASIQQKILTLPSITVLYPGHGAETTVKQEINNNPFLK